MKQYLNANQGEMQMEKYTKENLKESLKNVFEKIVDYINIGTHELPKDTTSKILASMIVHTLESLEIKDKFSENILEKLKYGLTVEEISELMKRYFDTTIDRARLNSYLVKLADMNLIDKTSKKPSRFSAFKLIKPEDAEAIIKKLIESKLDQVFDQYTNIINSELTPATTLYPPIWTYKKPEYVHETFIRELKKILSNFNQNSNSIVGVALTPTTIIWSLPDEYISGKPVGELRKLLLKIIHENNGKFIYLTSISDASSKFAEWKEHEWDKPSNLLKRILTLLDTLSDEKLKNNLAVIDIPLDALFKSLNIAINESTDYKRYKEFLNDLRFYGILSVSVFNRSEKNLIWKKTVCNKLLPSPHRRILGELIREGIVNVGFEAYLEFRNLLKTIINALKYTLSEEEIAETFQSEELEKIKETIPEIEKEENVAIAFEKLFEISKIYTQRVTLKRLKDVGSKLWMLE